MEPLLGITFLIGLKLSMVFPGLKYNLDTLTASLYDIIN